MSRFNKSNPVSVLAIALVILFLVSLLPLHRITDGFFKDNSFLSDIIENDESKTEAIPENTESLLDPDIANLLKGDNATKDSIQDTTHLSLTDTISSEYLGTELPEDTTTHTEPIIEDYTPDCRGLANLKKALSECANKTARIAFIGDSYIEGDIFTQNIREELQDKYGGCGIGFSPMHSATPGFRRSMNLQCSGWTLKEITSSTANMTLSGSYCISTNNSKSKFKGSKKLRHLDSWDRTIVLFISKSDADIKITLPDTTYTKHVTGSESVQEITVNAHTDNISISTKNPNIFFLGTYLDGNTGIAIDNMPMRGYAGIRHHQISLPICSEMRNYVDYDLIIIEYGINAISANILNYTYFKDALKKDIAKIRECYPNADILIMGVGDRGEKRNGAIHTMRAVPPMIKAQRQLARELGVLFWDTQLAMGGKDAIVEWTENKDTNKDYIHLSMKGGKRLGKIFTDELIKALE